jgi:hypothetical protein
MHARPVRARDPNWTHVGASLPGTRTELADARERPNRDEIDPIKRGSLSCAYEVS